MTTEPKPTATDRALAERILFGGLPNDYELALDRAAAIIASYRETEVQAAIGHVREVIDAYHCEATLRGDKKIMAWIDRCLKAMERREENQ